MRSRYLLISPVTVLRSFTETILLIQLTVIQFKAVILLISAISVAYLVISKCSLQFRYHDCMSHVTVTLKVINFLLLLSLLDILNIVQFHSVNYWSVPM